VRLRRRPQRMFGVPQPFVYQGLSKGGKEEEKKGEMGLPSRVRTSWSWEKKKKKGEGREGQQKPRRAGRSGG